MTVLRKKRQEQRRGCIKIAKHACRLFFYSESDQIKTGGNYIKDPGLALKRLTRNVVLRTERSRDGLGFFTLNQAGDD